MSAVEILQHEVVERPRDYRLHIALGHAYALLGRREEAIASGEYGVELMPTFKDAILGPIIELELAKILTRIGELDRVLDILDELLSIPGEISVPLLRLDPVWDPLRDHPRFQALLQKYDDQQGE
jgi:serine/threonine-protein kinase